MKKLFATLICLVSVFACASNPSQPRTVSGMSLEKYMGQWYEIARFENSFQKKCEGVRVLYSLKSSGNVIVKNQCQTTNDKIKTSKAIGKINKKYHVNSKLKVSFVPLFKYLGWFAGDYWIIDVDKNDYQYALVGSPDREFLWILSREKTLDQSIYIKLKDIAKNNGYNVENLIQTPSWK